MKSDRIRVGTSGWNYWHWRGAFYPEELNPKQWLDFYAQQFPTVELNSSFYRHHTAGSYRRWASLSRQPEASPQGFVWSLKAHREMTHLKRLLERKKRATRAVA